MLRNRMFYVIVVLILLPLLFFGVRSAMSTRPDNLGVQNGKLADCPSSPNCVCTQATDDAHQMEAIPFEGTKEEAIAEIKKALASLPRTQIITETDNYVHAESTSLLFRYVDDVEFFIDSEAKLIHFRSASRVGYSDLGVNRNRMKQIASQLKQ